MSRVARTTFGLEVSKYYSHYNFLEAYKTSNNLFLFCYSSIFIKIPLRALTELAEDNFRLVVSITFSAFYQKHACIKAHTTQKRTEVSARK